MAGSQYVTTIVEETFRTSNTNDNYSMSAKAPCTIIINKLRVTVSRKSLQSVKYLLLIRHKLEQEG